MIDPTVARTVLMQVVDVDARLRHPARLTVVDIGANDGQLLTDLLSLCRLEHPGLAARLHPVAIEVRGRPASADRQITWITGEAPAALQAVMPVGQPVEGVVIAHEWLDTIPCDVVEIGREGQPCLVMVDPHGRESIGPSLWDASQCAQEGIDPYPLLDWLDRWWPSAMPTTFLDDGPDPIPGMRAEIGLTRDTALAAAAALVRRGRIIVVDYGHTLEQRDVGRFDQGSLVGYRDGRGVAPVPDGSCDITAHVALDACAHAAVTAVEALGRRASFSITQQRDVLSAAGVSGRLPDIGLVSVDSAAYARQLESAAVAVELLEPEGLGGFMWLTVDVD